MLLQAVAARAPRSLSSVQPARATPMIGMSRWPRRIIACSAGKIFLYARSPVAPKNTSASELGVLMCLAAMDRRYLCCSPPSFCPLSQRKTDRNSNLFEFLFHELPKVQLHKIHANMICETLIWILNRPIAHLKKFDNPVVEKGYPADDGCQREG